MNEKTEWQLCPFPGMDPYLEAPDIWPDFHDRLATTLSAMLNVQLPTSYYARLQKRPELGVILEAGSTQRIIPDVTVLRHPQPRPLPASRCGSTPPPFSTALSKSMLHSEDTNW